jgi:hypothetical protein
MKSILDRTFKYVPARLTDVAATFRRIKREQTAIAAEQEQKVAQIKRKEASK